MQGWVDFYAVEGADSPVWRVDPVVEEPVPLPESLRADLAAWCARYDGTRTEAFDDEGRALLDRVRDALPDWRVTSTWYDAFPPGIDDPPPPRYESLPREVRQEVWLHAKHRERHPDPVVAEAAERWARVARRILRSF